MVSRDQEGPDMRARSSTSGGDDVSTQERTNLGLAVAAVTTERAQRGELPSPGPTRHGLGVDAEECRDLSGRQQGVTYDGVVGHGSSDGATDLICPFWGMFGVNRTTRQSHICVSEMTSYSCSNRFVLLVTGS